MNHGLSPTISLQWSNMDPVNYCQYSYIAACCETDSESGKYLAKYAD